MDATQRFRDRVHGLLTVCLASPLVARTLGIRGVSEVWGGATPLDRPGWYLWLHGIPGAYRIDLREADGDESGGALARLPVRYYPSRGEAAFASFSAEERAFVEGGILDQTGTPRADRVHEVPEDLFAVGVVEYALGSARGDEIAFSTMDRLRVRYEESATFLYAPLGLEVRHEPGDVARDVPGWTLGAPLFRVLAGLHAHAEQRAPTALTVSSETGVEYVYRGARFECVPSSSVAFAEAVARFDDAPERVERLDPALPLDLDGAWWSLARVPHEPRSCCSCCG